MPNTDKNTSYLSVHDLAEISGVTVRTLQYYDKIGLLSPARSPSNGYREYSRSNLFLLQQILLFRELEYPLEGIKEILASPKFSLAKTLELQKKFLTQKNKRYTILIKTIQNTMNSLAHNINNKDEELFKGLTKEEEVAFEHEARLRFGHTDAYRQSSERIKKMGKKGIEKATKEMEVVTKQIAHRYQRGEAHGSNEILILVTKHYDGLRAFYEPNLEIYRGLAEMYISDQRFIAYYETFSPGLAQFMHNAMIAFCEQQEDSVDSYK